MLHPLRSWIGLVCLVGLTAVVAACDSGGGAADPGSATGRWRGTVETDSVTYELTVDLERAEQSNPTSPRLVGSGTLEGTESRAFEVTDGTFAEPTMSLALSFRFDVPRPIDLQGTVDDEYQSISAELSGGPPRFDETPITLTRP